jgi:hypothetical protein
VQTSCVPWNLLVELVSRLSHAASDGRACDASVSEAGLLAAKSWTMMRSELLHEVRTATHVH